MIGLREIKQMYLGTHLVWPILPSDYTVQPYLDSNGQQYLDTELLPSSSNMEIVIDYEYISEYVHASVFGSEDTTFTPKRHSICLWGDPLEFYTGHSTKLLPITTTVGGRYLVDAKAVNGTLSVQVNGGNIRTTTYTQPLCSSYTIYLFGNNITGKPSLLILVRMYSCKIYKDNNLVRNLVPCHNLSGEMGMYCYVTNKFYKMNTYIEETS